MIKSIENFNINNKYITIYGSGNSINSLSNDIFKKLYNNSFTITLNYAPKYIISHCNIHSDKRVSKFLNNYYLNREKDRIFISRYKAFKENKKEYEKIYNMIDYIFDEEKLNSRYTISWLLEIINNLFSDKTIYIFGLDMYGNGKFYDKFTDYDKIYRPKNFKKKNTLEKCSNYLDKYIKNNNKNKIYNCNILSLYDGFEKININNINLDELFK